MYDALKDGTFEPERSNTLPSNKSEMLNSKHVMDGVIKELPEEEQSQTLRVNRFKDLDRPIETEFTRRMREEFQLREKELENKRLDIKKKWEEEVEKELEYRNSAKKDKVPVGDRLYYNR